MHELSIAISMIDQITEESENRGGLDVEAVHLKLGAFSGVDKEALLFAYELACEGSLLEGSRLVIEPVLVVVDCPRCGERRTLDSVQWFVCPECRGPVAEVVSGRELQVFALEIAAFAETAQ